MDKTIKFSMDDNYINIEVISSEVHRTHQISKESRSLNARKIYDLLDYSVGDNYSYEDIGDYGKESLVLNKLKDLFESITDQICNSVLSENDSALKEKIMDLDKGD